MTPLFPQYLWLITKDGDPAAYAIMSRHYSFQAYQDGRRQNGNNRSRKLFIGPGWKMVLITPDHKALFVWRKFIDKSGQSGINCAVFRNEGAFNGEILSSHLILAAEDLAQTRWPGERMYTYVNTKIVKGDGACFKRAGWKKCGRTKANNLLILEKMGIAVDGAIVEGSSDNRLDKGMTAAAIDDRITSTSVLYPKCIYNVSLEMMGNE